MGRAILGFLLLATLGGFLSASTGASENSGVGTANLAYRLGASFLGTAEATCVLAGVGLTNSGGQLEINTSGGRLDHHTFEGNYTVAKVPGWNTVDRALSETLRVESHEIPAGRVVLDWGPSFAPYATAIHTSDAGSVPTASFTATSLAMGTVVNRTSAYAYRVASGDDIVVASGGASGAHRTIRALGGDFGAHGDFKFFLAHATITTSVGEVFRLPERYEIEDIAVPGVVAYRTAREHYGLLTLRDAAWQTHAEDATPACRDLSGTLVGELTLHAATGEVTFQGDTVPFARRALVLQGQMTWTETVTPGEVQTTAAGRFDSLSVDFKPQGRAAEWRLVAQASLWAGLLGALGAAASNILRFGVGMFSRLTLEDVLAHPRRRAIVDAVRANPDCSVGDLVRATNIAKPVVRHHLGILEAHRIVRSYRLGSRRCFIEKSVVERLGRAALETRPDALARRDPVLISVMNATNREPRRLSSILASVELQAGVSRIGAWKAVRRAERHGLLEKQTQGREVWVRHASPSS